MSIPVLEIAHSMSEALKTTMSTKMFGPKELNQCVSVSGTGQN
jgi:hypothetical protein